MPGRKTPVALGTFYGQLTFVEEGGVFYGVSVGHVRGLSSSVLWCRISWACVHVYISYGPLMPTTGWQGNT